MFRMFFIVVLCGLVLPAQAQLRADDEGFLAAIAPSTGHEAPAQRAPALLRGGPAGNPRPRLSVSLSPQPEASLDQQFRRPSFSWSLEAWEMNTASLAHIQCNRATRSVESVVAEDCRFVDRPPPAYSTRLMQVEGRWMATPGVELGAGVYAGDVRGGIQPSALNRAGLPGPGAGTQPVEGVNLNLNFGMRVGQIGELLLDLQLDRYRQRTSNPLTPAATLIPYLSDPTVPETRDEYGTAAALGLGWQGGPFRADLTGQYQQLPLWLGEELSGEGFRSFDIEFSWRAPINASISVGVTNLLDQVPGATAGATDSKVEDTVEGIYGRIPYVRYKHDL